MSKAASKEAMEVLHALLTDEFVKILKEGVKVKVTVKDDDGNDVDSVETITPSSAQLNVIRQFLKDNNIEAAMTNPAMKDIVDNLPFDDSDLPPNAVRFPQNG